MGRKRSIMATSGNRSSRHSFVSELANAGIAPDVRQLLAGHSDLLIVIFVANL